MIVAFSGGVDSTLLAKVARDVLGKTNSLAVTADSASLAREDLASTRDLAVRLDLQHRVIQTGEVERPDYQANTPQRCFFCKQTLFEALHRLASQENFPAIVYGAVGDDVLATRPGHQAAVDFQVLAPLAQAGLTKQEVRQWARRLGLPNWDKPQNACLSSRIPHGQPVSVQKLSQVEKAEAFLRAQGFYQVRVRHLGSHARIEVEPEGVSRFNEGVLRLSVKEAFAQLGFVTVGINLAGYQPGGADSRSVSEALLTAIGRC